MPKSLSKNRMPTPLDAMPADISLIVPVYNEGKHVEDLIRSLESITKGSLNVEIVFSDGGSSDGTRGVLEELTNNVENVKLVYNSKRYSNHAFNTAFPSTTGKYVGFIGAHAEYPTDYCKFAFEYLENGECDAVGGPLEQVGRGRVGEAVAYCMSSKFGVGGTAFRTSKKKSFVDSVAMAVYRRSMLEDIGLMDPELPRNQDDELHYRATSRGYRILMVPEMATRYFVRSSLGALFKQYYRYGCYKPLVNSKVPKKIRLRHLIPAMFVTYLLSLPLALIWVWWLIPLGLYAVLDILFSISVNGKLGVKLTRLIVFPVLHFSYGLGYLFGCFLPRRFWHEGCLTSSSADSSGEVHR